MQTQSPSHAPRRTYDAGKARQGDVVLRHRWARAVFFGALAGLVILALVRGVVLAA